MKMYQMKLVKLMEEYPAMIRKELQKSSFTRSCSDFVISFPVFQHDFNAGWLRIYLQLHTV